ncbi:MAG: leucine-rich repeat domain-containing protein [Verrucomicrobiales bacterium]
MNRFAITLFAAVMGSAAAASAEDLFPDKALEAVVRQQVFEKRGKAEPLTEADVANISTVSSLKGSGIKSLKGLEKCPQLALLELPDNEIADLSPLRGLKKLQSLTLSGNKIGSIEPLGECPALQYINLENNQVADIGAVANLKALNSLYLGGNKIEDLKPVENLPKLWTLSVGKNPLKNLQPIETLGWLTSLSLNETGIDSLASFKLPRGVDFINLRDNKIADLGPIIEWAKSDAEGRYRQFLRLYLRGNPVPDAQREELKSLGVRLHE